MPTVKTGFSAQKHGFRFPNRFELRFPVQYPLPFGGSIDLNEVVSGLCGGMCFAALDSYYSGAETPSYPDISQVDPKLLAYLCDRQLDSLKIPVLLKAIEWILSEPKDLIARISRVEAPKIKKILDRGQPAVLFLVHAQGLDDHSKNRQVVATSYEYDRTTRDLTIWLYDPDHPGEEPCLRWNPGKRGVGMSLSQSTGEALRGFFLIPYQALKVAPAAAPRRPEVSLKPRGFAAMAIALQWPVDSRRVNQYFGENPDSYKGFGLPGHEGLDLYALSGANVYAAASGEVYQAGHPQNHPYGLHIRIRHESGGQVYHTVYAHLSEVLVQPGQKVSAGERIGQADNSGNSFGSHLHLTLKVDGQGTPGYPAGIVDPWPYLQEQVRPPQKPLPPDSGVKVYTTGQVNLRLEADTSAEILTLLPSGEALSVLGEAGEARAKTGQQGEWLQVLTAAGEAGYVAAWLVQSSEQAFPPSDLVVYPLDRVNLRSGPGVSFNLLEELAASDPLTVLGDESIARARLGRQAEWIQVLTEAGARGFVAAWLVHLTGQVVQTAGFQVYPVDIVNIRARPQLDGNILTTAGPTDALTVLGDREASRRKIGAADQWLNVQTPQSYVGYVAAWLVQASKPAPVAVLSGDPGLVVYPAAAINLRAQPSVNSPRVDGANQNEPLKVSETDLPGARAKIGQQDAWVYVEKANGSRGWAAAWYLSVSSA